MLHHLLQLLAFWKQIANGAHRSVSGLLFMNKFGICFQWRNELFKPRILFSVGNGAMNAPRNWQLCDDACTVYRLRNETSTSTPRFPISTRSLPHRDRYTRVTADREN
jgi:hypothetical protein